MVDLIPMEQFGTDHWSLLAYLETCVVDKGGHIEEKRLRVFGYGRTNFHTRLKDGKQAEDIHHDDYACIADMKAAGLIVTRSEFALEDVYGLTDYGWRVAAALRRHLAAEHKYAGFTPSLTREELLNTPILSLGQQAELQREVLNLQADLEQVKQFLGSVARLRKLAMEISLKYEPCGYYCDPDEDGGGHHDHKLHNWAKYLFGDGITDYLPRHLAPEDEYPVITENDPLTALRKALEHIAAYGAKGEADGTTFAADCLAMRRIAREALKEKEKQP